MRHCAKYTQSHLPVKFPRGAVFDHLGPTCYNQVMEVILTHENTDFDALASMLAAARLYPQARPIMPRRPNRNVRDFAALYGDDLPFINVEDLPRQRISRAILVDTQTPMQLRSLKEDTPLIIIDHHAPGREFGRHITFRGGDTGATTTILVEDLCAQGIKPTPVEATLLLLGIYEDTGSLSYVSTTPRDLRCAAWLLELGANLKVVNEFLHHPLTDAQRALYERLLEGAETYHIAGQVIVIATADGQGYVEEISTLAHKIRDLMEPAALFLLVAVNGRVQMVARSQSDHINVGEITQVFGGGGHDKAAAALIERTDLETMKRRLLEVLAQYVKPPVTVGEIMSHGAVRTLLPTTTVAEAAEMMQRFGHEGFPVIEAGHLVGVLRRREIDRAMTHGLERAPIATYMHKGAIAVSPHDSVQHLQRVMLEADLGQVPVVEEGRIIGIVTRTDLLKLWTRPLHPERATEIARLLEHAVPPFLLQLLKQASATAREMGFTVYAVGGFVRDLLLQASALLAQNGANGPPVIRSRADIDLVVEGDAISLARRLQVKLGGRVRSHARFGTAKWILPKSQISNTKSQMPDRQYLIPELDSLDFTSARAEFYEHPTALPSVERGSIKSDLHRRDFTINTMAISLAPDNYGQLLDFYGGEADLERGLIRVLHSLSFIEDPTRILRAVRLEQRLGFRIEPRTEELIDDALDLLDRVSGERIRHELCRIFDEADPAASLIRLDQLAVLRQLHPMLQWDEWLSRQFAEFPKRQAEWSALVRPSGAELQGIKRAGGASPECTHCYYLTLLTYRMPTAQAERLIARLKIPRDQASFIRQALALRSVAPKLEVPHLARSTLYHLLSSFSDNVLGVLWTVTESEHVREHLRLYELELRHIRPALTGHDLRAMNIPPGPIYRKILGELRNARLDGLIQSREEELALVRRILAGSGQ